jgi:hypothetical protein
MVALVKASEARPAMFPLTPHLTVFTDSAAKCTTPVEVLDTLNELAKKCLPVLSVLGTARFPIQSCDWRSTRIDDARGKSAIAKIVNGLSPNRHILDTRRVSSASISADKGRGLNFVTRSGPQFAQHR